jgi:sugar phosphate isomerase/epimerase
MITRRRFIVAAATTATALVSPRWISSALAGAKTDFNPELGICQSYSKSAALKKCGFQFIEGGVSGVMMPKEPDDVFAKKLEEIKAAELPVRVCNGFIPGELKVVGPEPKLDAAVAYATIAIRRAPKAGVGKIVLGSGGIRRIPDGFSCDKAREQFIEFCKKIAPVAQDNGIVIVLEPLNKKECNFITRVDEGAEIVDAVGHPGFQLHADIYHMMKDDETAESILKAGKRIRHVHVASKSRKAPGSDDTDFRPYFKALRSIGYVGGISCECGWSKKPEEEMPNAIKVLRQQLAEACA